MVQSLTYTQYGDYYIPDIRLEYMETQTLGKYGRMRVVLFCSKEFSCELLESALE